MMMMIIYLKQVILKYKNLCSDELFQSFLCSNIDLNRFIVDNIDRIHCNDLSVEDFKNCMINLINQ